MEVVILSTGNFSLRGTCPYPECKRSSVFIVRNGTNLGVIPSKPGTQRTVSVFECQGCGRFILGITEQPSNGGNHIYKEHYPVGSPDETVADEVPDHIKEDFKEALRCLWVKAYNATAEMCRRAMEASCLNLGAPSNLVLEKMIDWLEAQRIITPYLKEAAHKVRLGGNRGAHPPATPVVPTPTPMIVSTVSLPPITTVATAPVERIEKEHAEAMVEFTREFFHHVYVGPKLVGKYDFSKFKATTPPTK
jgi:hypothetical protein